MTENTPSAHFNKAIENEMEKKEIKIVSWASFTSMQCQKGLVWHVPMIDSLAYALEKGNRWVVEKIVISISLQHQMRLIS